MELLCASSFLYLPLLISRGMGADVWNQLVGRDCSTPCFSRLFNNWEVENLVRFFSRLQGKRVYREEEDRVI